jgi:anti-sigma factor RsiW
MAVKPACQPFFASLSAFIDGELSPRKRQELEHHLASCADCSGRVADLRAESGLVRVGMEMLADPVDFGDFAQKVMARIQPQRLPLFERMWISLSERFAYQRGMMVGAMAGAAAVAAIVVALSVRPAPPEGYANEKMALHSVTTDVEAHVAPVVMETDTGDSIIWVVDHAHVQAPQGAPDASQKEVDSALHNGQNDEAKPKGGEL